MKNLKLIGFDDWVKFHSKIDMLENHHIVRIVSVNKESYIISDGEDDIFAELSGKLMYATDSALDIPTTGDWVYVDIYDNNTHAIIHEIINRKTLIKRKSPGKQTDFQLIAANIDIAFIIQSLDYNFNLRRLERYLVMTHESGVTPVVLLSKSDLIHNKEIYTIIESIIKISPEITVQSFSNQNTEDIKKIIESLQAGKTYCLLGSSGVGKTTLLNNIIGKSVYETKSVSKIDNKGRHTTTRRELILTEGGAIIIDTPGMRELGNISVNSGIEETFSEIVDLSHSCKFKNCSHIKEKGCEILSALEDGRLELARYNNYIKISKETSFNEISYLEKKKKEKSFRKLIKNTIKNKHK